MRLGTDPDLGRLGGHCRDRCLAGAVPAFNARRCPPDRGQNDSTSRRLRRAAEVWLLVTVRTDLEPQAPRNARNTPRPRTSRQSSIFCPAILLCAAAHSSALMSPALREFDEHINGLLHFFE